MKVRGKVGFFTGDVETSPDIWTNVIVEKGYDLDVLRNNRRFKESDNNQNDELRVENRVSIISDLFALNNYDSIKYVEIHGRKIKANTVELGYPRIYIELGGSYNGPTANKT